MSTHDHHHGPRPSWSTSRSRRCAPTRCRRSSSRRRSSSSSTTADGLTGLGYSYTIGTGGTAVLAMLRDHLLPRLVGRGRAGTSRRIWSDLFASTRATTVGAITSLALAAVDTALWDLRCRRAGEPLWRLAGGFRRQVPLYDTEGGWLHLTTDELVAGALASPGGGLARRQDQGRQAARSRGRRAAARGARAVGAGLRHHGRRQPVDDGRRGDPPRPRLFEPLDLSWFEEPLPADDVDRPRAAGRVHARSRSRSASRCTRSRSSASTSPRGAAGHRPGRRGPDRRHHAVAEGRAPGRGVQRRRSARTS